MRMPGARRGEKEKIVAHLQRMANKIKLQYHGARGVEISVFPASPAGDTYAVEFAKYRVFRRVTVEEPTVRRLLTGSPDVALVRELRSALLAVIARAREEEQS